MPTPTSLLYVEICKIPSPLNLYACDILEPHMMPDEDNFDICGPHYVAKTFDILNLIPCLI
jgi:hypothetical protein